ncbi:hypothetical protein JHK87_043582 [Glycine soja]|nr:hypothetical protein JHK87_043582 [Glycine soja]KAG4950429.1 hypothetical protein JHK86_043668 [Glycine max]
MIRGNPQSTLHLAQKDFTIYDEEVSYPSSVEAYRPAPYATAPPPIGYPSKDGPAAAGYPQQRVPEETKTRGDGFWEGW